MTRTRLCSFTRSDALPCRDVATGRSRLCRAHQRQAPRDHRRTLALNPGRTVRLGPLTTHAEIRSALNRVIQLTAAGTLPLDRAGHALYRINLALAALNNSGSPNPPAMPSVSLERSQNTPRVDCVEDALNCFAVTFNPLTLDLEFAPAHLLSLIHPPTIDKTPASRRPSQPAVNNHSHHPAVITQPHTQAVRAEPYTAARKEPSTENDHFPDS